MKVGIHIEISNENSSLKLDLHLQSLLIKSIRVFMNMLYVYMPIYYTYNTGLKIKHVSPDVSLPIRYNYKLDDVPPLDR